MGLCRYVSSQKESIIFMGQTNPQVIYSSGPGVYDTDNHALRIKLHLQEALPLVYALRSLNKCYVDCHWNYLAHPGDLAHFTDGTSRKTTARLPCMGRKAEEALLSIYLGSRGSRQKHMPVWEQAKCVI